MRLRLEDSENLLCAADLRHASTFKGISFPAF